MELGGEREDWGNAGGAAGCVCVCKKNGERQRSSNNKKKTCQHWLQSVTVPSAPVLAYFPHPATPTTTLIGHPILWTVCDCP